ncbi:AMP-activated serine/threonine-protein kinase regulatory subunit [Mortierella sp. GBA43]|nr:AMP-activated serine/threonine-protein kinase regulatory subunit [Mortierella sp. GBA43]
MSETEENQDQNDHVLASGLTRAASTGGKSNAIANVHEEGDSEQQPSSRIEEDVQTQQASDTSDKPTAQSDSEHTGHQRAQETGQANPGTLASQGQDTTTTTDYFTHQASSKFNTVVTHEDTAEEDLLDSQNTPNISEAEQSAPSLSSRLRLTQPSSTLTTAIIRSRSNSDTGDMSSGGQPVSSSGSDLPTLGTASTAPVVGAPDTEAIDPIASYSAWRKKKDGETIRGTQAVMESFLKQHSAYDVLPVSYRQIVLDTTLLVKKALSVLMQYNIVSAPLWDSTKRKFAGMLTATDFINLIQFYYSHSSYSAAIREMDQFQISQLRDVEKVIGVPPPELFSLHPLQSLYDACRLLVEARSHRLPLVDVDSETGEEMIVSVLTQYRILKFIAVNYQDEKTLRQPLSELKIGIYTNLAVADLSTPVMSVIDMFVRRRISAVPIVDDDGVVLNVFETVDVMTLVKAGVYRDLDLCVAEALQRRPEDFMGVHTCTLNDSLSSIFGTIRKSQVHRLIVVDGDNKLKGIVSLSDIMRYLVGGTRETKATTDSHGQEESSQGPGTDAPKSVQHDGESDIKV